jgi:hypothetical protein
MAGYYVYLVSSLPMLHFGAKPPISHEKFLDTCAGLISEDDIDALKDVRLEKWHKFDMDLKNELVKIRAGRKHIDPAKYIRKDGYADPSVARAAMNAYRTKSIIESEKALDHERWNFLDKISLGHYFDIEVLIAYSLKLQMLERWEKVRAANKPALLEDVLKKSQ